MTTTATPLSPAELGAIEVHKYFLSIERGAEASIEEAIADFRQRVAARWRREKARHDADAQRHAIESLRHSRAAVVARDVSCDEITDEWCDRHAATWRAQRESLERNGFSRLAFTPPDASRALAVSGERVASTVAPFDCDVYVHAIDMPRASFVLDGRAFAHTKSVRGVTTLAIVAHDPLEFLATGANAREALVALREFAAELPLVAVTP